MFARFESDLPGIDSNCVENVETKVQLDTLDETSHSLSTLFHKFEHWWWGRKAQCRQAPNRVRKASCFGSERCPLRQPKNKCFSSFLASMIRPCFSRLRLLLWPCFKRTKGRTISYGDSAKSTKQYDQKKTQCKTSVLPSLLFDS